MAPGVTWVRESNFRNGLTVRRIRHPNASAWLSVGLIDLEDNAHALAVRASRTLRSGELYLTSFASTRLRMELDRVPLWRGEHVAVKQLIGDCARYLYLPRLKESRVLLEAIRDGVTLLPGAAKPTRFHGTAILDTTRVGRDASRIADEVISHLAGRVGARVSVTIGVKAGIQDAAPDNVVRTVTGNSRTSKFTSQGFEKDQASGKRKAGREFTPGSGSARASVRSAASVPSPSAKPR